MQKELRIFLAGVGIPAIILAAAGLRVVQLEYRHSQWSRARQEAQERMENAFAERRARAEGRRNVSPSTEKPDDAMRRRRPGMRAGRGGFAAEEPPPRPHHLMRVFSEWDREYGEATSERTIWLVGCLLGLAFLSLVAGGWLLVRSAKRAREDALRKTDFLSNISHEFKTPLTTICLCAELAQDEGLGAERRLKALRSIASEAERLKGLVLNALDFSRLEKGKRSFRIADCDAARLAREAGEAMRERFPEGLALPDGECGASGDPGAIKEILVILLDNAAKYAGRNGPVEVYAGPARAGSKKVCITVADRGPGMSPRDRRRAFDRFWRGDDATTAETGGSGLGLAIAKHLAEGMDGKLYVLPRDGGGLEFTLELKAPYGEETAS